MGPSSAMWSSLLSLPDTASRMKVLMILRLGPGMAFMSTGRGGNSCSKARGTAEGVFLSRKSWLSSTSAVGRLLGSTAQHCHTHG